MDNILFKSEEIKTLKETADMLRQIADKVEEGTILLKRGSEKVSINLPPKVTLEIEAEEKYKKGQIKESFEIEIEWIKGESTEDTVVA